MNRLAIALAWMAIVVPTGQADEKKETTELQVWAIRATTKNKEISPELKSIASTLKKQFKYTGFKLERQVTGSAKTDKTFSANLIGGYSVKIVPKRNDGKRVQLQVRLYKAGDKSPKINATITLNAGKFQLFGGPSLGDDDALILAVSAR